MKKLKSINQNLANQTERLEQIIEHREEIFNNRTWEWQESEKGEEYEEKTQPFRVLLMIL